MTEQIGLGSQELCISNWLLQLRPWEVLEYFIVFSRLVQGVSLQPLTSLRMLRFCNIEGMSMFDGWRSFKQELLAAQQAMGVTPAEFDV